MHAPDLARGVMLLSGISVVAIEGRALALAGPPGRGKSSLALALIDRGAVLVGDDGVALERVDDTVLASPAPEIAGMIELRGIGIARMETAKAVPLALILDLGSVGERLPAEPETRDILGCAIPALPFDPGTLARAIRAEFALRMHGLSFDG